MGVPPYRIEIITSVSGIDFETSYAKRVVENIDDLELLLFQKKI